MIGSYKATVFTEQYVWNSKKRQKSGDPGTQLGAAGCQKAESDPWSLRPYKYKSEMAEIFKSDSLHDNETWKPTSAEIWARKESGVHYMVEKELWKGQEAWLLLLLSVNLNFLIGKLWE